MKHDIRHTSYMALPGLKPGISFISSQKAQEIIELVNDLTKIGIDNITGQSRRREYVEARFICMYLIRKNTLLSLKAIGEYFGNRDHTSVIYSIDKVNDLCDSSEEFRKRVLFIENKLNQ